MSVPTNFAEWMALEARRNGGRGRQQVGTPNYAANTGGTGANSILPPSGGERPLIGGTPSGNPFGSASTGAMTSPMAGTAYPPAPAPVMSSSQPVPMSAQQMALMLSANIPQGMPGAEPVTFLPGISTPVGGTTGATTIQDIVDQAGSGYGSIPGMTTGNPTVDFLTSSGLPVNEAFLSQNIWDNPQMAIAMGGAADIGTPGYNNLANMGFDPYMVYLASGGDLTGTTGVEYANWLADLYTTMGTTADKGGGSIAAGPLLANLVSMPPESDLGQQMSESPQVFYDMANGIMEAGGMSPMAEQAFKSQMANLYMEYLTYMSGGNANEILPINQWISKNHPEVVDAWAGK